MLRVVECAPMPIPAILLFAVSFALPCQADLRAQTASRPAISELTQHLRSLKSIIRKGIGTKSPNASFVRRAKLKSVFDGSFDWHSCVIAYWSLLVIGRNDADRGAEVPAARG